MAAAKAKQAEAQSDDEPEADTEAPVVAPKNKLPLKMIVIAAAGLLVLGGGGAAAYLFFGGASHDKPAQTALKPAIFVDLPDVLVNLSNAGTDRTQYLKVKIVLCLLYTSPSPRDS